MSSIYDVEISMCRSSAGPYQSAKSVLFRMAFHEVLHEYRKDKSMFFSVHCFVDGFHFFVSSAFGMGISCLAHTKGNYRGANSRV